MKKVLLATLLLFCATSNSQTSFNFEKLYSTKDTIRSTILLKRYTDDTLWSERRFNCISSSSFTEIYENSKTKNKYYYYTNDTIVIVDFVNENFSYGNPKNNKEIISMIWENGFDIISSAVPFYLHRKYKNEPNFSVTDTTIDKNKHYKLIKYKTLSGYKYNPQTQTLGDEIFDSITILYNEKISLIEKISLVSSAFPTSVDVYEILNIQYGNNGNKIWNNTIIDINSKKYQYFTKYNLNKNEVPYSELNKIGPKNITDTLLRFPLVNANHDTTCINVFKDWLLIDFWIFGCIPCAEFHQKLKTDYDNIVNKTLKTENIDLICVYILGGASQTFNNYVKKFGIENISYAARDIPEFYDIPHFPTYLLLSPDKKIVYSGWTCDIDNMIRLKRDYEKQHNLKP